MVIENEYAITGLLNLVDEKIHPQKLLNQSITKELLSEWQIILQSEGKSLKHAFLLDVALRANERRQVFNNLLYLSNTVNRYLFRFSRIWRQHAKADLVKVFYLQVAEFLELLIESLGEFENDIFENIPISDFRLPSIINSLKVDYQLLKKHLDTCGIDEEVKGIFLTGINKFIKKKQFTRRESNYIQIIFNTIIHTPDLDTPGLKNILCRYDFNTPELYAYLIKGWQKRLTELPGFHEQLEMILSETDHLRSLQVNKANRLLTGEEGLVPKLQLFLEEKSQTIKQFIKLRRATLKDNDLAKSSRRLRINLPVAQFGLFIRLQVESGLLRKENIGDLFAFFAAHFYTPQTVSISAESLQKKSSDVEYANAAKMKGHLIGMLNWLNEHFKFNSAQ